MVLADGVDPAKDPDLPLRAAVAAAERDLPIAAATLRNLARAPINDAQWSEGSRKLFLRLLGSGSALPRVWEELDFVDIPGRWVPEWLGVRNRPSASAVHRYTVDRHMVEVTAKLSRQSAGGGTYDDEHYASLLLAGIFHDIGKRPGVADHASEGARHTRVILTRMGFPGPVIEQATLLVAEHLTLSAFAVRRDPEDHQAVAELTRRVHSDPVLLDMLYDLTRADGSSLGATAGEAITKRYGWSRWRASVVGEMYAAARLSLQHDPGRH